jgi:hypothetical protein
MTLLIAGTSLLCCAETAHAHPHMWIKIRRECAALAEAARKALAKL